MRDYAQSQLQSAYETILHANCASDWNRALQHAQNALVGDHDQRGKATLYIAHVLVHTGKLSLANSYLSAFLRKWGARLPKQYPYAIALAAQLAYRQGEFKVATRHYQVARRLFAFMGNTHEVERASLSLVWSYARVGKLNEAFAEIPVLVSGPNASLWRSVRCYTFARNGQREEALKEGRLAVDLIRKPFDQLGTAETLIEMESVTGDCSDRLLFTKLANEFASRQAQDVRAVLVLSYRQGGGDLLHAETDNRGSADPHDGCSLTTGIA